MWVYYFRLAGLSLVRTPLMSGLMILAIAIGIATCLTTFTVYSVVSNNSMAHKNEAIAALQLDSWDPTEAYWRANNIPLQLTYKDAEAIREANVADQFVAMFRATGIVKNETKGSSPSIEKIRVTTRDFFPMFDVNFVYGGPWDASVDDQPAQKVIINETINHRMFGGENGVGRSLLIDDRYYQVVGVVDDNWRHLPKVYDLNNGAFNGPASIYLPFSNAAVHRFQPNGNYNGWKAENFASYSEFLQGEAVWTQAFVGFNSPQNRRQFEAYLRAYISEQKSQGRFERPLKYVLSSPAQWLKINKVVPQDTVVLLGLSVAFLLVCLLNTITLLLAKFSHNASEAGVRRALGATRTALFSQHIIEALVIAILGAVMGLLLSMLGLWGVRGMVNDFEHIAVMNVTTCMSAIFLALFTSLVSGVLPAWKISKTPLAVYLKTQ